LQKVYALNLETKEERSRNRKRRDKKKRNSLTIEISAIKY
jgi:hypothetical protein